MCLMAKKFNVAALMPYLWRLWYILRWTLLVYKVQYLGLINLQLKMSMGLLFCIYFKNLSVK